LTFKKKDSNLLSSLENNKNYRHRKLRNNY